MNRLFPGQTEVQKVEAALRRYQAKYDRIQSGFVFGRDVCCPTCKYPELVALGGKIERVEKWLRILKMKETKQATLLSE